MTRGSRHRNPTTRPFQPPKWVRLTQASRRWRPTRLADWGYLKTVRRNTNPRCASIQPATQCRAALRRGIRERNRSLGQPHARCLTTVIGSQQHHRGHATEGDSQLVLSCRQNVSTTPRLIGTAITMALTAGLDRLRAFILLSFSRRGRWWCQTAGRCRRCGRNAANRLGNPQFPCQPRNVAAAVG